MNKSLLACLSVTFLALTSVSAAQENNSVASWAFVESLGGLKVGTPVKEAEGWTLPVECDLTGLRKVSVDPTSMNSSLMIREQRWSIQSGQLRLQLLLKPSSYATPESRCQPITLTQPVAARQLEVVYEDGGKLVPLGTIRFDGK